MQHHKIVLVALACAGLGGCVVPQNTVLFATNTTVALDLSINPTDGTPNIIIGYKRQEGVVMPLLASKNVYPPNAAFPGALPPGATAGGAGTDHGPGDALLCDKETIGGNTHDPCVYRGTQGGDADTYSVLASIGADVNGNVGTGTSGTAAGGVAVSQFFATGFAARELARSGGAALINTNAQAPGTLTPEQKVAVDAALKNRQDALQKITTLLPADNTAFQAALPGFVAKAYPDATSPMAKWLNHFTTRDELMSYLGHESGTAELLADKNS